MYVASELILEIISYIPYKHIMLMRLNKMYKQHIDEIILTQMSCEYAENEFYVMHAFPQLVSDRPYNHINWTNNDYIRLLPLYKKMDNETLVHILEHCPVVMTDCIIEVATIIADTKGLWHNNRVVNRVKHLIPNDLLVKLVIKGQGDALDALTNPKDIAIVFKSWDNWHGIHIGRISGYENRDFLLSIYMDTFPDYDYATGYNCNFNILLIARQLYKQWNPKSRSKFVLCNIESPKIIQIMELPEFEMDLFFIWNELLYEGRAHFAKPEVLMYLHNKNRNILYGHKRSMLAAMICYAAKGIQ